MADILGSVCTKTTILSRCQQDHEFLARMSTKSRQHAFSAMSKIRNKRRKQGDHDNAIDDNCEVRFNKRKRAEKIARI